MCICVNVCVRRIRIQGLLSKLCIASVDRSSCGIQRLRFGAMPEYTAKLLRVRRKSFNFEGKKLRVAVRGPVLYRPPVPVALAVRQASTHWKTNMEPRKLFFLVYFPLEQGSLRVPW